MQAGLVSCAAPQQQQQQQQPGPPLCSRTARAAWQPALTLLARLCHFVCTPLPRSARLYKPWHWFLSYPHTCFIALRPAVFLLRACSPADLVTKRSGVCLRQVWDVCRCRTDPWPPALYSWRPVLPASPASCRKPRWIKAYSEAELSRGRRIRAMQTGGKSKGCKKTGSKCRQARHVLPAGATALRCSAVLHALLTSRPTDKSHLVRCAVAVRRWRPLTQRPRGRRRRRQQGQRAQHAWR